MTRTILAYLLGLTTTFAITDRIALLYVMLGAGGAAAFGALWTARHAQNETRLAKYRADLVVAGWQAKDGGLDQQRAVALALPPRVTP